MNHFIIKDPQVEKLLKSVLSDEEIEKCLDCQYDPECPEWGIDFYVNDHLTISVRSGTFEYAEGYVPESPRPSPFDMKILD